MTSLQGALLASTGNQDRRPHGAADGPKPKAKRKRKSKRAPPKGPLFRAMVEAATK